MITARLSLPVQSMTGYAQASAGSPRGTLSLELRSVNARFLDVQLKALTGVTHLSVGKVGSCHG